MNYFIDHHPRLFFVAMILFVVVVEMVLETIDRLAAIHSDRKHPVVDEPGADDA